MKLFLYVLNTLLYCKIAYCGDVSKKGGNASAFCEGQGANCGNHCYDPATEKCFEARKFYPASVCPKNLKPCTSKCYDPNESHCFEHEEYGEILCPLDSENVEWRCEKKLICEEGEQICDRKCYNPSGNKCIDGMVCRENENVCGKKCYVNSDDVKCSKGVVCKINEEVCGRKCYNPTTVDPHFHCRKLAIKLRTLGTIEQEYMACDPGYDLNMNGDCQRVIRMASVDFESDEN